ncbi:MAG: hypothetical protein ACK5P7_08330 [Bdellovibrio sp.]|jgi:hypothetical protein
MTSARPPELLSISQCDKRLQFACSQHWPEGLPAVAVNGLVLAGFGQTLVFNHQIEPEDQTAIGQLVTSLYPQMSFMEAARFWQKAHEISWLPLTDILSRWNVRLNEAWIHSAQIALALPVGFQAWMIEKKFGAQDMMILGTAQAPKNNVKLEPLLHAILATKASRTQGAQILETGVELALMGMTMNVLIAQEGESADTWADRLKLLRYPQTSKKDSESEARLQNLPWPGHSQARWVRQGDKAGLELKIFVSNPSDLKKSVTSLQKLQDLLEENPGALWPKH